MKKRYFCCLGVLVILLGLVFAFYISPKAYAQSNRNPGADGENQLGKLSLDIKGMDVVDVLKILAMRGNLNIVAGSNVRGKVTLFLKNVEVMDALEIILAANNLAYEKKDGIINVMAARDYELLYGEKSFDKKIVKIEKLNYAKATEMAKILNEVKSKIGKVVVDEASNTCVLIDLPPKVEQMQGMLKDMDLPTATKTFALNYAKAKDLEEAIKESLTKNVGELKVDERMNKLIVTDLPRKMDYISRLISDFDERDKVVLIEAKIIQITLNQDTGYGVNWNNIFAGIDTIAQSDLSINLSGVTPATTFTYTRAHGATEYGDQVILRLLENLGKTDVLSTPRITVANNQEAKVLVGTEEAYVTSTVTQSNGTTTTADNVEFVDVGVSLTVTPTISEDGYISMKIKPEVSSAPTSLELTNADGSVRSSIPIVTTSEAETQLVVKDGTTIIMAGLMKDTRKDNSEKVPFLSDIPILGHLFKSRGREDEKTELVIFLTPHIIKAGEDDYGLAQQYIYQHEQTGIRADNKLSYKPLRQFTQGEADLSTSEDYIQPPEDFPGYCTYISDKVRTNLEKNSPSRIKQQRVQLHFVLNCDGSLKDSPQILSPVDVNVRDLVIESVEQASPFFPFPDDCEQQEKSFGLTVSFEKRP